MKTTVASVNKALKRLGFEERLARGNGYYYFYDGDAEGFYSSSIPVYSISDMSIESIIDDLKYMKLEYKKQMKNPLRFRKHERITMINPVNYAIIKPKFGYLSDLFIANLAMIKFNLTLEQLEKIVGRNTKGVRKGQLKGKLTWKKVVKGGWVKTGPYDEDRMRAHGYVAVPGKTFDYQLVDSWTNEPYHFNPIRFRKYRKGHVGNWILLGKIWTKHAPCHECGKELKGEQLIYTHFLTKEKVAICQGCVKEFEKVNNNPLAKREKKITIIKDKLVRRLSRKERAVYRKSFIPGFDDFAVDEICKIYNETGLMI